MDEARTLHCEAVGGSSTESEIEKVHRIGLALTGYQSLHWRTLAAPPFTGYSRPPRKKTTACVGRFCTTRLGSVGRFRSIFANRENSPAGTKPIMFRDSRSRWALAPRASIQAHKHQ